MLERDYTEKIQYLKEHRGAFIGEHTIRSVVRFLKRRSDAGDPYAMMFALALKAEVSNIQAKIYEFSGDENKRTAQYRVKHECLRQLCAELRSWNIMHNDKMILYGYGTDYEAGLPVLYFHLPDTEQISFHDHVRRDMLVPSYPMEWDGEENSTLPKLRQGIINRYFEHIHRFFDDTVVKTEVLQYSSNVEIFDNIRKSISEEENAAAKEEYIRKSMCDGLGFMKVQHEIKDSQKIEQENGCPPFIFKLVNAEYNRVCKLKSHDNSPSTSDVESLITNLKNMKAKKRKFETKVCVKKVRSVFGKYLVSIDFRTERGGTVTTSFYSSKTPLKKNSPEWISRADVTPELPSENVKNIEKFIKNYIK